MNTTGKGLQAMAVAAVLATSLVQAETGLCDAWHKEILQHAQMFPIYRSRAEDVVAAGREAICQDLSNEEGVIFRRAHHIVEIEREMEAFMRICPVPFAGFFDAYRKVVERRRVAIQEIARVSAECELLLQK